MPEYDFFSDAVRSIANAEVSPGEGSPCEVERMPVAANEPAVDSQLVIQVDSGRSHPLGTGLVFGRRPEALADVGHPMSAIEIADEEGLISRNHLALFPQATGAIALDLSSTNGTTLHRNGQSAALPPNQPVNVEVGDKLELGARLLTVIDRDAL